MHKLKNKIQSSQNFKETYETGRRADDLESEMDKIPYEVLPEKMPIKKKVPKIK